MKNSTACNVWIVLVLVFSVEVQQALVFEEIVLVVVLEQL